MKPGIYITLILLVTTAACNNRGAVEKAGKPATSQESPSPKTVAPRNQTGSIAKSETHNKEYQTKGGSAAIDKNGILTGIWFTPHGAEVNIQFLADSTFVFNDYNSKLQKEEKLTGRCTLTGHKLTLIYTDRPGQIFTFRKGEGADKNYYITGPGYYFVKSDQQ